MQLNPEVTTSLLENYKPFSDKTKDLENVKVIGYKYKYSDSRFKLLTDLVQGLREEDLVEAFIPWLIITDSPDERTEWLAHINELERKDNSLIGNFICIDIENMMHIYNYAVFDFYLVLDLTDDISIRDLETIFDYSDFKEVVALYNEYSIDSIKRLRYSMSDLNFIYLNTSVIDNSNMHFKIDKAFDIALIEANFIAKDYNNLIFDYYKHDSTRESHITFDSLPQDRLLWGKGKLSYSLKVMSNPRQYYSIFTDKINILTYNFNSIKTPTAKLQKLTFDKIDSYKTKQKEFVLDNKTSSCINLLSREYNHYKTVMVNPLARMKYNINHIEHPGIKLHTWKTQYNTDGIIVRTFSDIPDIKKTELLIFTEVTAIILQNIQQAYELNPGIKVIIIYNAEHPKDYKIIKIIKKRLKYKNYDIKNYFDLLQN